jgi:ABC-2 type transport system ATP-binding protein
MPAILAENLSKGYPVTIKEPGLQGTAQHFFRRNYRTIQAVQAVSFQIEPGEVVGFLGANGAGKTTTLKMLTGLIHPSAGKVTVAGYVPFQRKAGFLRKITLIMGQKQQLIWDLPALDSLRINAAVYGISDRDFQQKVGNLTEMLALEGKLTQPVRKLSLGERMKAELLAALIHHPEVLFLDEPTLGLDVNAQISVREFLRDYNQRYGATVLLTSHYMADITALCQRVLVVHQGQMIYDGSLEGLVDRFAPCREVTVELSRFYPVEKLSLYADVEAIDGQIDRQVDGQVDGQTVKFLVPQEMLTRTVAKILSNLEVVDLAVTEPPIEEVIGRVLRSGSVT